MQLGLVVLAIVNVVLLVILLLRKPASTAGDADAIRETLDRTLREQFAANRRESAEQSRQTREELAGAVTKSGESIIKNVGVVAQTNEQKLGEIRSSMDQLIDRTSQRIVEVRGAVEQKLGDIQKDNAAKLEQMRATVDEKLQSTLEARLGESFRLVSERLEAVHKGLGEMQSLASGVGDLKKVLTNVKTRGTWGEVQLGNLLEQIFRPEQYDKNVAVKPLSGERVDYAIRLPGPERGGLPVWLPIDAKFPREDYERLVDAADRGDADAVTAAAAALEARIRAEAKKIRDKYICPPHTTEFAILFLPTEGLFAEVLRRPGVYDDIIGRDRVVLAGPTTLAAVLNSLQMGFRTLALEQRSSEVWEVLGAVKTEFAKFGATLERVHEKLQQASRTIEDAQQRSRVMTKKLKDVEGLPAVEAQKILPMANPDEEEVEDHADAAGAS
jgi:DNA recombination protein RmuC